MWFYGCREWKRGDGPACSFYLFDEWEQRGKDSKQTEKALRAAAERGERWAREVQEYDEVLHVEYAAESTGTHRDTSACCLFRIVPSQSPNSSSADAQPGSLFSCEGGSGGMESVDNESVTWWADDVELGGATSHDSPVNS